MRLHFIHTKISFSQDNCENDDIHVEIVVASNEVHESDIAKLLKYKIANSVEQADLFYSATR